MLWTLCEAECRPAASFREEPADEGSAALKSHYSDKENLDADKS